MGPKVRFFPIALIILMVGGGILYSLYKDSRTEVQNSQDNSQIIKEEVTSQKKVVSCTQEAKQCPDGSYVSRTGPNCEFAVCPQIPETKCDKVGYRLENRSKDFGDANFYDSRLMFCDGKGNMIVLVNSIKAAVPELQEEFNFTLGEFSFPNKSSKLFFESFYGETDSGVRGYYIYDIIHGQFSKMTISNEQDPWGEVSLSPDGLKFAQITGDGSLTVFYLNDDTFDKPDLKLEYNETVVQFISDFASSYHGDFKWIDNKTIEYSVYNDSLKSLGSFGEYVNQFIGKRILYLH